MGFTKTCTSCKESFEIRDEDLIFYKKIEVPSPTLCQDCRQKRRLTHRNLSNLYHQQCGLSKKKIISNYSPDKPFVIYDQTEWWSDKWSPMDYGMDFNFSKPFFEQFNQLRLKVPRPNLLNKNSENSQYTNHSEGNKNVYMGFNVGWCEDCMYITNFSLNCKNCMDCYCVDKCELCYECVDSKVCFNCAYAIRSSQCSDCAFIYDCKNLQNCFMCYNLRNKKFHILNQPYSKEEYEKKLKEMQNGSREKWKASYQQFLELIKHKAIHRYTYILNSENCTGDFILNCKNVWDSYFALESQDCYYCYDIGKIKDSYDAYEPYMGELQYECHACNKSYQMIGCSICYENNNLDYCEFCYNCSYLFGCIGLRHKQYCVLNKQYTKESFNSLKMKIIEHMRQTGEWGEFFPSAHSPFAYNESVAQEYFSLEKKEALQKGFKWKDKDSHNYKPSIAKLPDTIKDVSDAIISEILACEDCSRNYQILAQELEFYRRLNLPAPAKCFFCRHALRMALRNQRKLWDRNCTKCNALIKSTYGPSAPEIVYCEKCYLDTVF